MSVGQEAISGLYTHECASLRRYLARKMGTIEDAEDLAQDTYLRMMGSNVADTQMRCPKAFLFAVASNLAVDSLRRRQRERAAASLMSGPQSVYNGKEFDAVCPRRSPEEEVDFLQRIDQILASLRGLSKKCRTAFIMHKFMDMSYAEVAERLGVTVSMIEKYLSQSLHQVREFAVD
jgi:RNA polymerase sigma-19 factor, ECF subfamily